MDWLATLCKWTDNLLQVMHCQIYRVMDVRRRHLFTGELHSLLSFGLIEMSQGRRVIALSHFWKSLRIWINKIVQKIFFNQENKLSEIALLAQVWGRFFQEIVQISSQQNQVGVCRQSDHKIIGSELLKKFNFLKVLIIHFKIFWLVRSRLEFFHAINKHEKVKLQGAKDQIKFVWSSFHFLTMLEEVFVSLENVVIICSICNQSLCENWKSRFVQHVFRFCYIS